MASKRKSKKSASKISLKTAERVVAVSLEHPDLGARRLVPLLKKQRVTVSASTIQSILRREGLQNREKRLAKIKKQTREKRPAQIKKGAQKTRKPESPTKKALPKITDDVAGRICEISLQNPDLGAKSLAPLLKEHGISVSSSAVYRILKQYDLQTRAKRYTRAAEITPEPVIIPKTFPEKIPPDVEDRIVDLSLQNPEYGARRLLPLLQQEEIFISVSAVFRILKRNELENRQKRLLKIEALQAPEAQPEPEFTETELFEEEEEIEPILAVDEAPEPVSEPAAAAFVPPGDIAPELAEEPEPTPEPAVVEAAEAVEPPKPERPPVRKAPAKIIKKRSHWVFYPLYLLLLLLIGYLGFHTVQTIQYTRLETGTRTLAESAAAGVTIKTEKAIDAQPLDGYRLIWERNLFNTGKDEKPDLSEKIALAKLAPAKKGLGLELVGTVVADDPRLSRAIIDNRSIRKQEAYREGDSAGKAKIKKILRNNVVITTADGDELLTVEVKESGRVSPSMLSKRVGSQASPTQRATGSRRPSTRTLSLNLKRDEVAASLADIDTLIEQIKPSPYMQGDQPSGFRLGSIPGDSVLRKMGLRYRDVIVGVDDEAITDPSQAANFFQRLARGGEVTIKLKRRRRSREIKLNIE